MNGSPVQATRLEQVYKGLQSILGSRSPPSKLISDQNISQQECKAPPSHAVISLVEFYGENAQERSPY